MADPHIAQVVLYMDMEDLAGPTSVLDKRGHVFSSHGNAALSHANSKYGESSLYLDGLGDYLTASTGIDDFNFGNGDFTIEFWTNKTGNSSTGYDAVLSTFDGTNGFFIELSEVRGVSLTGNIGAGPNTLSGFVVTPINDGLWHHWAFCKLGSMLTIYKDGVSIKATALSGTGILGTGQLCIGGYNSSYFFNGFIDEVRVTKGVCRYSGTFTPTPLPAWVAGAVRGTVMYNGVYVSRRVAAFNRSTGALIGVVTSGEDGSYEIATPDLSEVYVVCFAEVSGTESDPFFDAPGLILPLDSFPFKEGKGHSFTNDGVTLGSGGNRVNSAYFSGGKCLSFDPSDDLSFRTGDFTVEAWIKPHLAPTGGGYINQKLIFGNSVYVSDICCILDDLTLAPAVYNCSTGSALTSSLHLEVGQWAHVAWVRKSGVLKIFVNGIIGYSGSFTLDLKDGLRNNVGAGSIYPSMPFTGNIESMRVTKGVARYQTPFDTSTGPLPTHPALNAKIFDYLTPEAV